MMLIQRHLVRTFIPPFLFGLSVTTFLLMIDVLERYINLFLEKGIQFGLATEVLLLSLGHTFALSIPMAVMVGTLMSIGHLASDHEITAMKACGVSLYRITRPLFLMSVAITLGMMAYNHWVLPESNHKLRKLLLEIQQLRPTLEIKENTFAEVTDEFTIYVQEKVDRTGFLRDVILYQREGRGDPAPDVIKAATGKLETVAHGRIRLDLFNGEHHTLPDAEDPLTYNRTYFEQQTFFIDLDPEGGPGVIAPTRGEREMNVRMLADAITEEKSLAVQGRADSAELLTETVQAAYRELETDVATTPLRPALAEYRALLGRIERASRALDLKAATVESHRIKAARYGVELHKKFSIPVACMVFVVLGVPLAVVTSRGGRGVSIGMSLACFLIYYLFLSGGEKLADRGHLVPWISMWAPNLVLGTAGIVLLYTSVQETRLLSLPAFLTRRRDDG